MNGIITMKKILLTSFLFLAAVIFCSNTQAQVVVTRPNEPVAVKPTAPYPNAVWVEPEWRWDAPTRAYVYVKGFWVKPRGGYIWDPGHWMTVPGGYQWVTGHWRKIKRY